MNQVHCLTLIIIIIIIITLLPSGVHGIVFWWGSRTDILQEQEQRTNYVQSIQCQDGCGKKTKREIVSPSPSGPITPTGGEQHNLNRWLAGCDVSLIILRALRHNRVQQSEATDGSSRPTIREACLTIRLSSFFSLDAVPPKHTVIPKPMMLSITER